MVIEKINDFVDVWAKTIGLNDEVSISMIKEDIIKRYKLYNKLYPTISVNDDPCLAYIIKPINGEYNLEDFFLNRLMLGIRSVSLSSSLEGNNAEYTAAYKSFSGDIDFMHSQIKDKSMRHPNLKKSESKIILKTIEHELGHCLKTKFSDGYKAPRGFDKEQNAIYCNLINNLLKYKNGKYAMQIKKIEELIDKEESIDEIKTGIRDSEKKYGYHSHFSCLDEALNEAEALQLTNSEEVHEICPLINNNGKISSTGNKVNVYNYMSGYRSFTNYGTMLKMLLGRQDLFHMEYISSTKILEKFEKEYEDIIKEFCIINSQHYSAVEYLFILFGYLQDKRPFNEDVILELDHFFAKCYSKKIDNIISKNNGILDKNICDAILKQIKYIKTRLTTNDNIQMRESLSHIVILNQVEQKIKTIYMNTNFEFSQERDNSHTR